MRTFVSFLLGLFMSAQLFATGQSPDLLVYGSDTIPLLANPLNLLEDFDTSPEKLFGSKKAGWNTGCWRGYIAQWVLIDKQLYLDKIYACDDKSIMADLSVLFGDKYSNGRVKADWVTDTVYAGLGKMLYYIHSGYGFSYERELELQFKSGKLIDTKLCDNSKSKYSVYGNNSKEFLKYIQENIRWNEIPKLDTVVKVIVVFSANEDGVVDSARVLRGYNEIIDREAIRIIKSTPEWDVYMRRGKVSRILYTAPVVFREEDRKNK